MDSTCVLQLLMWPQACAGLLILTRHMAKVLVMANARLKLIRVCCIKHVALALNQLDLTFIALVHGAVLLSLSSHIMLASAVLVYDSVKVMRVHTGCQHGCSKATTALQKQKHAELDIFKQHFPYNPAARLCI